MKKILVLLIFILSPLFAMEEGENSEKSPKRHRRHHSTSRSGEHSHRRKHRQSQSTTSSQDDEDENDLPEEDPTNLTTIEDQLLDGSQDFPKIIMKEMAEKNAQEDLPERPPTRKGFLGIFNDTHKEHLETIMIELYSILKEIQEGKELAYNSGHAALEEGRRLALVEGAKIEKHLLLIMKKQEHQKKTFRPSS